MFSLLILNKKISWHTLLCAQSKYFESAFTQFLWIFELFFSFIRTVILSYTEPFKRKPHKMVEHTLVCLCILWGWHLKGLEITIKQLLPILSGW